jgi:LytS/YehU family sensor histidine kinase
VRSVNGVYICVCCVVCAVWCVVRCCAMCCVLWPYVCYVYCVVIVSCMYAPMIVVNGDCLVLLCAVGS